MKNVKQNQLKKCIFMELDEFTRLVEDLTEGLQTVEYEDGAYLISTDKADETDTFWKENITETLSKYFDVEVTSFHSDNCEYVGVWICYKEIDKEYKVEKEENAMSKWSEIRCNFFDEKEKKYFVDAWKTGDDNEEGTVIAKINLAERTVEYLDEDAKTDEYAQEIINEMLEEEE